MGVHVEIVGGKKNTDEYEASIRLKELLAELPGNVIGEVVVFPSATLFGQAVKDIDIVVLGELRNYEPQLKIIDNGEELNETVCVKSICLTIEVKSHDASVISRQGTDWLVPYGNRTHNVTDQSNKQKIALMNFFNYQLQVSPYITNVIWFTETTQDEINNLKKITNRKLDSNVLSGDSSFKDFVQQVVLQTNPHKYHGKYVYDVIPYENSLEQFSKAMSFFSVQKKGMGELTRKRVEQITKKSIDNIVMSSGEGKISIYRGRAGTGKTIGLIQTAIHLVDDEEKRVLILTYNKLLVADIKRLFALAELPDMFEDQCVEITTLHAFYYRLLNRCVYDGKLDSSAYLDNYESFIKEAIELLNDEAAMDIVREQCSEDSELDWDYVFVDEAQDWTSYERDLLLRVFKPEQIVVADGGQQFVRKISPCDWLVVKDRNNVKLKKCLRQKKNLIKFLNNINDYYEINTGKIVGSEEMNGGRVLVVSSDDTLYSVIRDEVNRTVQMGNTKYDCLCMVSPDLVQKSAGERRFKRKEDFLNLGIDIWDGTNPDNRDNYGISAEQMRVIQYDSARGLEGWLCICMNLDTFIEDKMKEYQSDSIRNELLLESEEELKTKYLLNWLFVPLTRAIETIVISVADVDSEIGKMLKELSLSNPDYITWL